jgi:23S rRNA (adenine1618-N6)-methyltransferase
MLWTPTSAFQKNPLSMASLSRKMVVQRSGTVVYDTSGNSGSSYDRKLEHRSPKSAALSEKRRQKRQQQQNGESRKNTDNSKGNVSRIHPRNAFQGSYNMDRLCAAHPNVSQYIIPAAESRGGRSTIDFSSASSVRALNAALLAADYGVHSWAEHLPINYLCPPVPGRADYMHYIADVLAESLAMATEAAGEAGPGCIGKKKKKKGQRLHIPTGPTIHGLDIGTGSSIIYPLIGTKTYGWSFIGTDVNQQSIESANRIISSATDIEKGVVYYASFDE